MPSRRDVARLALAASLWPATRAGAQAFPSKAVRIMLGLASGGSADTITRVVAQAGAPILGQQVLVENKPGAGTTLAAEAVARSDPDGYTLYGAAGSFATSAVLLRGSTDYLRALTPVILFYVAPYCIAVNPRSGIDSIARLVAEATRLDGKLLYATSGVGSQPHFAAALFQSLTQTRMKHVPYRGLGPAVLDVINGQVPVIFSDLATVAERARDGALRILAVTSEARSAAAPGIPTMREAGLAGYDLTSWLGVLAPTGTPAAVIATLNRGFAQILARPEVADRIAASSGVVVGGPPETFRAHLESETALYRRLAASANITTVD